MPQMFEHKQYDSVASGALAGSVSALQLPDIPCRAVFFTALASNVGKAYLGGPGVTIPSDSTTDTTSGIELQAGDMTPFIPISNLNKLFRICENAGDDLTYFLVK